MLRAVGGDVTLQRCMTESLADFHIRDLEECMDLCWASCEDEHHVFMLKVLKSVPMIFEGENLSSIQHDIRRNFQSPVWSFF